MARKKNRDVAVPTRTESLVEPMKPKEIQRLMDLRDWDRAALAKRLGVNSHVTIWNWLTGVNTPPASASMVMRQWLDQAEAEEEARKDKPKVMQRTA